jgi:hypothetical protein
MEKTIFLFRRHPDRSREDFARHYVTSHAPLGARLTRCLQGYTVNIVEDGGGWDAVTEHWLPAAMDIMTPDIAYATPEDFQAVLKDDRTLFDGTLNLYVATAETWPVPGEPRDAPMGTQTPEIKLIWFYPDASAVPPPPAGARRVVDNRIGYRMGIVGESLAPSPSDIAVIRMAWAPSVEALGSAAADAIAVREYRFIAAPKWNATDA